MSESSTYRDFVEQSRQKKEDRKGTEYNVPDRTKTADRLTIVRSLMQSLSFYETKRQLEDGEASHEELSKIWKKLQYYENTLTPTDSAFLLVFRKLYRNDPNNDDIIGLLSRLFTVTRNNLAHTGFANNTPGWAGDAQLLLLESLSSMLEKIESSSSNIGQLLEAIKPQATKIKGLPVLRRVHFLPGSPAPTLEWWLWTPDKIVKEDVRVNRYNTLCRLYFPSAVDFREEKGVLHNLPFNLTKKIVPRAALQSRISRSLNGIIPQTICIYGEGGIGKTTEVLHYCHEQLKRTDGSKPSVILFYSSKRAYFDRGRLENNHEPLPVFSTLLKEDLQNEAILSRLRAPTPNVPALVVLDNCEDAERAEVQALIDICEGYQKINLIVTQRNNLDSVLSKQVADLSILERKKLLKKLWKKKFDSTLDDERAQEIAAEYPGKPLYYSLAVREAQDYPSLSKCFDRVINMSSSGLAIFMMKPTWAKMETSLRVLIFCMTKAAELRADSLNGHELRSLISSVSKTLPRSMNRVGMMELEQFFDMNPGIFRRTRSGSTTAIWTPEPWLKHFAGAIEKQRFAPLNEEILLTEATAKIVKDSLNEWKGRDFTPNYALSRIPNSITANDDFLECATRLKSACREGVPPEALLKELESKVDLVVLDSGTKSWMNWLLSNGSLRRTVRRSSDEELRAAFEIAFSAFQQLLRNTEDYDHIGTLHWLELCIFLLEKEPRFTVEREVASQPEEEPNDPLPIIEPNIFGTPVNLIDYVYDEFDYYRETVVAGQRLKELDKQDPLLAEAIRHWSHSASERLNDFNYNKSTLNP